MATAGEKMDPAREEFLRLYRRLLIEALKLFASEKCFGPDAMLPGVGKCAEDLVADTIVPLVVEYGWVPGSGSEDPFPVAVTIMRNDFKDLVKSATHKRTESVDLTDLEQHGAGTVFGFEHVDAKIRLDSFKRFLADDELSYLDLRLRGFTKVAEIAREMELTEQQVRNIKRRLTYKTDKLERSDCDSKDQ
jgi:DNA-directed RNA polymerase specialized sigma24 family protein